MTYICSTCRRTLLRRARRPLAIQWPANAAFHSLAALVPPPSVEEKQLHSRNHTKEQDYRVTYSKPPNITFDELFVNKQALRKPSRYSRTQQRGATEEELAAQFSAETAKEEIVEGETSKHGSTHHIGNGETVIQAESAPAVSTVDEGWDWKCIPILRKGPLQQNGHGKDETESPPSTDSMTIGPATELHNMLQATDTRGQDLWSMFLDHYPRPQCRALTHPLLQDRLVLTRGRLFSTLLTRLTSIWLRNNQTDVPSPAQVVQKLRSLHVMRPEWHVRLIWRLVSNILHDIFCRSQSQQSRLPLLEQLLSLWAQFFQDHTKHSAINPNTGSEEPIDWSCLPRIIGKEQHAEATGEEKAFVEAELAHLGKERKIDLRLAHDLQDFPGNLGEPLAASAVATLVIMTQRSWTGVGAENGQNSQPLLRYLSQILYKSNLTHVMYQMWGTLGAQRGSVFKFENTHLQALKKCVFDIPAQIDLVLGTGSADAVSPRRDKALTLEESENLAEDFKTKIFKQIGRNNTRQVIRLWSNAQKVYTKLQFTEPGIGIIPPKLYANFLYAFGTLNRPDMADAVWNHMIASKILPSVEHWSAMMKGRGKRWQAVEEIWTKMIYNGIEPDVHIWTTRIHILLTAAPTAERGLSALEWMGQAWKRAVAAKYGKTNNLDLSTIGDLPGAPKPTVVTLNAAVSALASRRNQDRRLFPRVFAWANQFDIKPNERTYNSLIQECLSEGNMQEAMKILERMEQQGVQPDGATFGLFINHIFRKQQTGDPMNTEQQEEMLASIIRALEERGMESDPYTMGLLFDILVKQYSNLPAAQKVLEYMAKKGMRPSAHIYTILLTHHFQKADDPDGPGMPDFPAIEALWNHIEITGGIVDRIFYDRMIEGYARAGEPGEAMTFLGRMGREAKRPGWQALYMLVKSLADNGMMDRVREVVHDVENYEGNVREGIRGYNIYGVMFWDFIVECGIRSRPQLQMSAPADEDAKWLEGFKEREAERKDMAEKSDLAERGDIEAEKNTTSLEKGHMIGA
jgi:pentatricopeptide repeat protein